MEFSLRPIGVVRSAVTDPNLMPGEGVPARVEIFAPFAEGLERMEINTHVTVVAWFDLADRENLTARRRETDAPRGVFTTRSPNRPNPLGITTSRIVAIEGNTLHLANLDFVDGTPVVDVKGSLRGWDFAWAARSFRDTQLVDEPDERYARGLLLFEAENFHGERCPGLVLGVRMTYHVMRAWQTSLRDPALQAIVGVDGHVADAVQAITGATLGNGRLRASTATAFHFIKGDRQLSFYLHDIAGLSPEQVLEADEARLFSVREGPATHNQERPANEASPLEGARREEVMAAINNSLVDGKLPCPVAFKVARDLGVGTRQVGRLANEAGYKISQCQLGCFK